MPDLKHSERYQSNTENIDDRDYTRFDPGTTPLTSTIINDAIVELYNLIIKYHPIRTRNRRR